MGVDTQELYRELNSVLANVGSPTRFPLPPSHAESRCLPSWRTLIAIFVGLLSVTVPLWVVGWVRTLQRWCMVIGWVWAGDFDAVFAFFYDEIVGLLWYELVWRWVIYACMAVLIAVVVLYALWQVVCWRPRHHPVRVHNDEFVQSLVAQLDALRESPGASEDRKTSRDDINAVDLPGLFVDEEAFERNLRVTSLLALHTFVDGMTLNTETSLAELANHLSARKGLRLRLATKSVRIPYLIKKALGCVVQVSVDGPRNSDTCGDTIREKAPLFVLRFFSDLSADNAHAFFVREGALYFRPFIGIMTFSVHETVAYLSDDEKIGTAQDILVAYPVLNPGELKQLARAVLGTKAKVRLMVDSPWQARQIRSLVPVGRDYDAVSVCVDVDASLPVTSAVLCDMIGLSRIVPATMCCLLPRCVRRCWRRVNMLHFGVRRSAISAGNWRTGDGGDSETGALRPRLKECLQSCRAHQLRVDGVMCYDAQVAGVPDEPDARQHVGCCGRLQLRTIRIMQWFSSYRWLPAVDRELAQMVSHVSMWNVGGTGSLLTWCTQHSPDVKRATAGPTEVTIGSGLLHSHLFDRYATRRVTVPAVYVALGVTRRPATGIVTCRSGGFIASGPPNIDRAMLIVHPKDGATLKHEGFGEVQTPIVSNEDVSVVLCRPSKAGEISERFARAFICKGGDMREVYTYRGMGHCFY